MTLDEFMREELSRISRFGAMWHREHRRNEEAFPMEMEPGEWDEQYRAFEE